MSRFAYGVLLLLLCVSWGQAALTVDAESQFVTNVGGPFSGSLVNDLVGADRFYDAGYTGSNATASNIEAGHIWNGHSSLTHITQFSHETGSDAGSQTGQVDRHATWVGQAIGGRPATDDVRSGIAPNVDLRSGAIATEWNGPAYSTSFSINSTTFYTPYTSAATGFGSVDVINSSWGLEDASGTDFFTQQIDGLAGENPTTTVVFAAGNNGSGSNSVGGAGSGYNTITVGALSNDGSDNYDTIAGFSSRGPQDYGDPINGTIENVRAPVDITAPGDRLTLAFYGGTTGGNDGGTASGSPNTFSSGVAGTSFAAPIVAGGVALMHDAARGMSLNASAHDARVIKANLLNSADKPGGWSNGQSNVGGVVTTTQSLDYTLGAGAMNLDRTFDQYLLGQTDIAGTSGGTSTSAMGWDFANVNNGSTTDIILDNVFGAGTTFTTTLIWFRDRESNSSLSVSDNAFADLNLEVWDSTFTTQFAESISLYNPVEHLAFDLPSTTSLALRVDYTGNRFGSQTDADFALAWSGTLATEVIPAPGAFQAGLMLMVLALGRRGCFCRHSKRI